MGKITTATTFLLLSILLSICEGAKEWKRPEDGRVRLVTGNDGVQTIVFESPTQGTWEIGNGEIWHLPIGGSAQNKTSEFEPIPKDYIEKKKVELKTGSIRNQGDASASIRPFAGNKPSGGGGSIRNPASGSGSIRTKASSGSIRGGSGKKQWIRPNDGRVRLVTGNDGVQTIVFESPTQGTWEIGNGEIWHLPIGGTAKNVAAEFEPIPKEYIEKKKTELKAGSIRNQGDASASIRPFAGNKPSDGGGSIRNHAPGSGSIRTQPSTGSIRNQAAGGGAGPSNSGPQLMHLPKLWTIEELGNKALIDTEQICNGGKFGSTHQHMRKDDQRNYKGDILLLGQFKDGVFVSERRIDGDRMGDATTRLVEEAYGAKKD